MACPFEVFLNEGNHQEATDRAIEALDLVDDLEAQLSVYRQRSEISQLNAIAAQRPVKIEAQLFELLQEAVTLCTETGGAFDITSGPLIKVWGFLRREGRMPSADEIGDALSRVGSQYLNLDQTGRTVSFARPGVEVNLGGIGKGFALDRCCFQLLGGGVSDFMIHGGNSSILARGERSGSTQGGWMVGIRHPLRPDQRLAEIVLRNKSIGTSGTGTQYFYHQGKRYGHIIDPRNGQPSDGVLSTTVVAPRASIADALSTAFHVMGVEKVTEFCQTHPDVGALITRPGLHAGTVQLHAVGLSDDEWKQVGH
jgi:thiamine biosynthesis lipoprotein